MPPSDYLSSFRSSFIGSHMATRDLSLSHDRALHSLAGGHGSSIVYKSVNHGLRWASTGFFARARIDCHSNTQKPSEM
jgi:hypothetical protein